MREQAVFLKHHAHMALLGRQMCAGAGEQYLAQMNASRAHRLKTRNRSQHGGLAAARGPQQAGDMTCRHLQIKALQHGVQALGRVIAQLQLRNL